MSRLVKLEVTLRISIVAPEVGVYSVGAHGKQLGREMRDAAANYARGQAEVAAVDAELVVGAAVPLEVAQ